MKKTVLLLSLMALLIGETMGQNLLTTPYKTQQPVKTTAISNSNYYGLGYCTQETLNANDGLGIRGTATIPITAAIKLTTEKIGEFAGDHINGLHLGFNGTVSGTAFVKASLSGEYIASKTFESTLGWNEVIFDQPLLIEAGKAYFIGYTIQLSGGQNFIGITPTNATQDALHLQTSNGRFRDYTNEISNVPIALAAQALLTGDETHFTNRAILNSVTLAKHQVKNKALDIPVSITNDGKNDITKLELAYTYGGSQTIVPLEINIPAGNSQTVTLPSVVMSISGDIVFSIHAVNGVKKNGKTISKKIEVYDPNQQVERKILLEQFTTENCGFCPRGTEIIRSVIDNPNFKDKVIWVSHHSGYGTDDYTISHSEDYLRFYYDGTFAPAVMIDRSIFTTMGMNSSPVNSVLNHNGMTEYINTALAIPTFVTVDMTHQLDKDDQLQVTIKGKYKGDRPTDPLYVVVMLTEDGLQSDKQAGHNGTYTHNNVLRSVLNGTGGTVIEWTADNQYTMTVTGQLNANWNKDNMNITALVAKDYKNALNNVNVLNTVRQPLEISSGMDHSYAQKTSVYAKENKIVVNGTYTNLRIFHINGQEVANNVLPLGVYLVRVENGNDFCIKKVIVR